LLVFAEEFETIACTVNRLDIFGATRIGFHFCAEVANVDVDSLDIVVWIVTPDFSENVTRGHCLPVSLE
jgi:hypothetical protein